MATVENRELQSLSISEKAIRDSMDVMLTLSVWCSDVLTVGDFKSDLLEKVKKAFPKEGVLALRNGLPIRAAGGKSR